MDDQSRNLILATALSFLVILGWFVLGPILFPNAFPPPVEETAGTGPEAPAEPQTGAVAPPRRRDAGDRARAGGRRARDPRGGAGPDPAGADQDRPAGGIAVADRRADRRPQAVELPVSVEPGSPIVTLLTPAGAPEAYYSLFGWAPAGALAQSRRSGRQHALGAREPAMR